MAWNGLPYYRVYPGDEKRNGSRDLSLRAEGFRKRLKDEAHDTERRGYFYRQGQPMNLGQIALKCEISPEECAVIMTELVSAKLVSCTADGAYFLPDMIAEEKRRLEGVKWGKKGWAARRKDTPSTPPSRGGLKTHENDMTSVVVSSVVAGKVVGGGDFDGSITTQRTYQKKDDPLSRIIYAYKEACGFAIDDRDWDLTDWGRSMKTAPQILGLAKGDVEVAVKYVKSFVEWSEKKKREHSIETLIKSYNQWRADNGR